MAEEFTAKLFPPLGLPFPRAGGKKGKQKALTARDVITNSSPKRLNSSQRSKTKKTDKVKMVERIDLETQPV